MPKSIISTKKTQSVKINDSTDLVKILGIYFTKDLRKTGIYNWKICLTQIGKKNTTTFQTTSVFKRKSHTSEFLDFIQNNLLK